jgi:hypothetical protein
VSIVDFVPILADRALSEAASRAKHPSLDAAPDLKALVDAYERKLILGALAVTGGHQRHAAQRLRVLPTTLNEKMKRLGIRLTRVGSLQAGAPGDVKAALLWRGCLATGATLELRGLNGPVRVDASEDGQVEVAATQAGPRSARSAIALQVVEHRHGVSVCAVRQGPGPAARIGEGLTAEVDLVARVPPGVHVIASTSNGDVEVVGVSGNVEAGTTNGRVVLLPAT